MATTNANCLLLLTFCLLLQLCPTASSIVLPLFDSLPFSPKPNLCLSESHLWQSPSLLKLGFPLLFCFCLTITKCDKCRNIQNNMLVSLHFAAIKQRSIKIMNHGLSRLHNLKPTSHQSLNLSTTTAAHTYVYQCIALFVMILMFGSVESPSGIQVTWQALTQLNVFPWSNYFPACPNLPSAMQYASALRGLLNGVVCLVSSQQHTNDWFLASAFAWTPKYLQWSPQSITIANKHVL